LLAGEIRKVKPLRYPGIADGSSDGIQIADASAQERQVVYFFMPCP
jgi:hypothetical protein